MDSILTSIKKLLGIEESYDHFNADIIMCINSAIMTLTQIGVGPPDGFCVTDADTMWSDFIGTRKDLEAIKTYVYLSVRLVFDPPQSGFLVEAINRQRTELEWRLNVIAEST